jgi:hypothetical protein
MYSGLQFQLRDEVLGLLTPGEDYEAARDEVRQLDAFLAARAPGNAAFGNAAGSVISGVPAALVPALKAISEPPPKAPAWAA